MAVRGCVAARVTWLYKPSWCQRLNATLGHAAVWLCGVACQSNLDLSLTSKLTDAGSFESADAQIVSQGGSSSNPEGQAGGMDGMGGVDGCPEDPDKTAPGSCGCGVSDAPDADQDGTPDCNDSCPDDASKSEPGVCGCGAVEDTTDSDADGSPDCVDDCPDDPEKTVAQQCGCGQVEDTSDVDGDGTAACLDGCPEDALKTAPGVCGCGMDDSADSDSDGTADCLDSCPDDPEKTAPGACGCGMPDSSADAPHCTALSSALVHRYRFKGTGTTATDSIGTAHGTLLNTSLTGSGVVVLAGGNSGQCVSLPAGLLSGLTNASFEAWLVWSGGDSNQRLFDFGESSTSSYLFLTPRGSGGAIRFAYKRSGQNEDFADATGFLSSNVEKHVVAVFNDAGNSMDIYVDALDRVGQNGIFSSLSQINDTNNSLGCSQFSADPALEGTLLEFRIYNRALTAQEISFTHATGPDPAFLEP